MKCDHPDEKHTIWYWIEDGDPIPVPHVATFDNRKDAVRQAESWVKEARPSLRWMKIFRSDNEMYTCWRWENPAPSLVSLEEVVVQKPAEPIKKKRWWRKRNGI